MKRGAVVEPDAVKKMKSKTDQLADELKKTSAQLLNRTEELNNNGFQDGNFEQLYSVISENKENLLKLNKVMISFSDYLIRVEKNIRDLVGTAPLKRSNIKID
jgi:predicted  nucleic acid-binding Zn-ribbon protein